MEKKIFGIILTFLGAIGIILAAWYFINTGTGIRDIKLIAVYGIVGMIFFFSGIALIRTTKDKSV
jgi:hypothetical protein